MLPINMYMICLLGMQKILKDFTIFGWFLSSPKGDMDREIPPLPPSHTMIHASIGEMICKSLEVESAQMLTKNDFSDLVT